MINEGFNPENNAFVLFLVCVIYPWSHTQQNGYYRLYMIRKFENLANTYMQK